MYEQFFSGSDVDVYVSGPADRIRLDKCASIAFAEAITASPTYGIGDAKFKFSNSGNLLVSGTLDINFIHPAYLIKAIDMCKDTSKRLPQTVDENYMLKYRKATYDEVRKSKDSRSQRGKQGYADNPSGLGTTGFDIVIRLNNSGLVSVASTKSIILSNVRILTRTLSAESSGGSNLVERFSFIAKESRYNEY